MKTTPHTIVSDSKTYLMDSKSVEKLVVDSVYGDIFNLISPTSTSQKDMAPIPSKYSDIIVEVSGKIGIIKVSCTLLGGIASC